MMANDARLVVGINDALAADRHFGNARLERNQRDVVGVLVIVLDFQPRAFEADLPSGDRLAGARLGREAQALQPARGGGGEGIVRGMINPEPQARDSLNR